jgi:hypothetical protein
MELRWRLMLAGLPRTGNVPGKTAADIGLDVYARLLPLAMEDYLDRGGNGWSAITNVSDTPA